MGRSEQAKRPKKQVEVVKCPSAFPVSSKGQRKRPRESSSTNNNDHSNSRQGFNKRERGLLDWHDTAKEIRSYGAQAFSGKQKRDYEDEKYYQLTGRHKKKPSCPLPIVRGIKKAAAKREARQREEAKQAGIVIAKPKKEDKKYDSTYKSFGPAPSIGFVKKGVYRMNPNKGRR